MRQDGRKREALTKIHARCLLTLLIYISLRFQGFSLPLSERPKIQSLIGEKAERLSFIFCMVDRSTVDQTVFSWRSSEAPSTQSANGVYATFKSRPELGRFDIEVTKDEWLDFIELTLADWLEQVEGAAAKTNPIYGWKVGESYTYRRLAYRKMSQILAKEHPTRLASIAPVMLKKVMETESNDTRHLIQPRTPPTSDASAAALDALRAIGENIPIDLSPQPISSFTNNKANSDDDNQSEL